MKKILLFASVFAVGSVFAQADFTKSNETENGTYSFFVCDSTADNMADITGTGVTWDYSDLRKYDGETKSLIVDDAANVDFPDAEVSSAIEGLINDYWKSDASARYRYGIVISEANLGDVASKFDSAMAILSYPFAFNDSKYSNFTGNADTQFGPMPFVGNHKAVYDGYGTLKVGNTTVNNVSRLHYTDTLTIQSGLAGDIDVYLEQIEYYDLANSTTPIFIHSAGSISIMGEFGVVMSSIEPTEVMPDDVATTNINSINFTVSPNPVKNQLRFNGEFANADIQIINQAGQSVYNGAVANGTVISTTDFQAGIYVVKATIDSQVITKKIVKF